MRVLKKGTWAEIVFTVECPKCDSILEYTNVDIQKEPYSKYNENYGSEKFIICPVCENTISHQLGKVKSI